MCHSFEIVLHQQPGSNVKTLKMKKTPRKRENSRDLETKKFLSEKNPENLPVFAVLIYPPDVEDVARTI